LEQYIYFNNKIFLNISLLMIIDLDVSKICLKKQKGVMHKFNIQHIRTLEMAHIAAMNLEYWEDAEFYGKELLPGYLSVTVYMYK